MVGEFADRSRAIRQRSAVGTFERIEIILKAFWESALREPLELTQ